MLSVLDIYYDNGTDQKQEREMGKLDKLLLKVLSGASDTNVTFEELTKLLRLFGFEERIKGSHHIYYKEGIE